MSVAVSITPPQLAKPAGPTPRQLAGQRAVTGALILAPVVTLALVATLMWGRTFQWRTAVLAVAFYAITGHGVTVGYHRLFTHRSFKAQRWLKIVLGVAGSMAIEGSLLSWVSVHRVHHMFSDRSGDPHSPHVVPSGRDGPWSGFVHAHIGWLFGPDTTCVERYAPDLLADPDLVMISRLFPVLAVSSLLLPFGAGWVWTGSVWAGVDALAWAGIIRMALLHHVTWSINSICHLVGRRPYATSDLSANVAVLAVLSFGESWHNSHHAQPASARHGVGRHQVDSSASLIRLFERAGWVTKVRWPRPGRGALAPRG
jgi:stearoyl-CoA desaturase (Delta-9 desaturase)